MIKGLQRTETSARPRSSLSRRGSTTNLTDVATSPNSFFSEICLNCIAACCLEHDGCAMGISVTCEAEDMMSEEFKTKLSMGGSLLHLDRQDTPTADRCVSDLQRRSAIFFVVMAVQKRSKMRCNVNEG